MTKTRTLYQVREVTNGGTKQLGRRLRSRTDALRVGRILRKAGRDVYASPMQIDATEYSANGRRA